MGNLAENLKKHLAETPKEQLEQEWKEIEKYNNVGPIVFDYLDFIKNQPKTIDATIGYRIEKPNGEIVQYVGGDNEWGDDYIYKDKDAFNNGKGVCYISALELEDYESQLKENYNLTDEEYFKFLNELNSKVGYRVDEFIKECFGNKKFAEYVLDTISWEYVSTFMDSFRETFDDSMYEYCLNELGFTKEQIKEYFDYSIDED